MVETVFETSASEKVRVFDITAVKYIKQGETDLAEGQLPCAVPKPGRMGFKS